VLIYLNKLLNIYKKVQIKRLFLTNIIFESFDIKTFNIECKAVIANK